MTLVSTATLRFVILLAAISPFSSAPVLAEDPPDQAVTILGGGLWGRVNRPFALPVESSEAARIANEIRSSRFARSLQAKLGNGIEIHDIEVVGFSLEIERLGGPGGSPHIDRLPGATHCRYSGRLRLMVTAETQLAHRARDFVRSYVELRAMGHSSAYAYSLLFYEDVDVSRRALSAVELAGADALFYYVLPSRVRVIDSKPSERAAGTRYLVEIWDERITRRIWIADIDGRDPLDSSPPIYGVVSRD